MLIVGAGGLAAQLIDDILAANIKDIVFWSEVETEYPCIRDNFDVIGEDEGVINYFSNYSSEFVVGIWDIKERKRLTERFLRLGGKLTSFITPYSYLSSYTEVGNGSIVLQKAGSEPGVIIGSQCILNKRCNFGHGGVVSDFCSIGPYSIVASNCFLGESTFIGMGAIIQPKVRIGKHVIISAGAVVTRNIPDFAVVSGNPATIRFFRKDRDILEEMDRQSYIIN